MPDENASNTFLRNIWSVPVTHTDGDWMRDVRRSCESIRSMEPVVIDKDDVSYAVRSLLNWKTPGPDGLHNSSNYEAHLRVWHLNFRQHWIRIHY